MGSAGVALAEGVAVGDGDGDTAGEAGVGEGPSSTAMVAGVVFDPPPLADNAEANNVQAKSVETMRISMQTSSAAQWFRAAGVR